MATVKFMRATYKEWKTKNPIVPDGMIIYITNIPWYRSWFRLRPVRLAVGDGKTTFNKLKFI